MDERIIRAKIDAVGAMAVVGRWPIGGWRARTADNPAPGEYRFHGDWKPVPDESFWQPGATLFLRVEAQVPGAARDTVLYAAFDILHLEGLLSIDGNPWQGIDAQHPRAALPVRRGRGRDPAASTSRSSLLRPRGRARAGAAARARPVPRCPA